VKNHNETHIPQSQWTVLEIFGSMKPSTTEGALCY
jgi:hypothetical protein